MSEESILLESSTKYVEWRIKNFFNLPTNDYYASSRSFRVSGADWFLRIYPNGDSEDDSVGWIDLYLFKQNSSVEYNVSFRIGIQNFDGSKFKFFKCDTFKFPVECYGYGKRKLVKRYSLISSKKTVAPDGFLILTCSFRIHKKIPLTSSVDNASQTSGTSHKEAASLISITSNTDDTSQTSVTSHKEAASQTSITSNTDDTSQTSVTSNKEAASQTSITSNTDDTSQTSVPSNKEAASRTLLSDGIDTLYSHFMDMYINRRLTDVTINVKNREFQAHKFILASHSSVFTSMFENHMAEAKSGKIEIHDCDPDIFEYFLHFLYSGKLETESLNNVVSLYYVSNKYDVQELKNTCKDLIKCHLSIDSICDVIHLATIHFEIDLLASATDFFIKNADSILSTTKWFMFLEENPIVGNGLFLKILKSKKSNG